MSPCSISKAICGCAAVALRRLAILGTDSKRPILDACLRPICGRENPEKSTRTRDDLVTSETQQTVAA
jgi:hypothetical protein